MGVYVCLVITDILDYMVADVAFTIAREKVGSWTARAQLLLKFDFVDAVRRLVISFRWAGAAGNRFEGKRATAR